MTTLAYDVAVVGGGPWGRALAHAAARTKKKVMLVSRRAERELHDEITLRHDFAAAAEARLLVLAVPSGHIVEVCEALGGHLDGAHLVVHGVRGLVGHDLRTVSDIVRAHTPVRRLGALGGPALVPDLEAGKPALLVVGSRYPEVISAFREGFASPSLRLYATSDLTGLEWASALIGCYAVAMGFAAGHDVGPGLLAGFTTRVVHELARIAIAAGGERDTMLGLSGLGDLLATIGQTDRPEVIVGRALAQGKSLAEARAAAGMRVEAIDLLPTLLEWSQKHDVRAVILQGIAEQLVAGRGLDAMIATLMTAPIVDGADS